MQGYCHSSTHFIQGAEEPTSKVEGCRCPYSLYCLEVVFSETQRAEFQRLWLHRSQGALAVVGSLVGGFAGEGATPLVVARRLLLVLNFYEATV